jgi:hypothetical protein
VQHADKKQKDDVDSQLNMPPAGVKAEYMASLPEWQDDAIGNQFMAQMAARSARGVDGRVSSK